MRIIKNGNEFTLLCASNLGHTEAFRVYCDKVSTCETCNLYSYGFHLVCNYGKNGETIKSGIFIPLIDEEAL